MSQLKPNAQRAKIATIFLFSILGLNIVAIISSYMQYDLLNRFVNGGAFSVEEANANDMREVIVSLIMFCVYIGCAITFIMWFRRAYYNLHQLHAPLLFPEGWAAGAWFVPFMNLGRPVRIMNEMMTESETLLVNAGLEEKKASRKTTVAVWWTLWLIHGLAENVVTRLTLRTTDPGELAGLTMADMIIGIFYIPTTLMAIKVIRDYSKLEQRLPELEVNGQREFKIADGELLDA